VGEALLGVISGSPVTIYVMRNLVNENAVEVKLTDGIQVVATKLERMSTEEDARSPVDAVAT